MLKRFYVDNFRCLEDFEFRPKQLQLLAGLNGTGKSTIFDALDAIRRITSDGEPLRGLVGNRTVSKGRRSEAQRFEIDVLLSERLFHYALEVAQGLVPRNSLEELSCDGEVIFRAEKGKIVVGESGDAILRQDRSILAMVPPASEFGLWLDNLFAVRIEPSTIMGRSEKSEARPTRNLSNLASWFRHLSQEDPKAVAAAGERLSQVIPDLDALVTSDLGEDRRVLRARFRTNRGVTTFTMSELSDGQRALICLYLLTCNLEPGTTLLLDEPENFIALAEIQPWLLFAQDRLEEVNAQIILASHHPEVLNILGEDTIVLQRDDSGHLHAGPFKSSTEGLRPDEIMARGWESA